MPPQLIGILAMAAAGAVFTGHDAITKHLSERYPLGEIIFWRQLSAVVLLTIYVQATRGIGQFRPVNVSGQAVRGIIFVMSTVLIAASVAVLPLAVALSIVFASPIVVAMLSATMLGEPVGPRRWLAILLGFAGVLIIIRPGTVAFTWLLLVPVCAATCSALRDIITRRLHRTENTHAILFWSNIIIIFAMAATLPFGWKAVALGDAGLLLAAGALNVTAHFLTITALRYGEAALVTPYRYTALVWAAVLGFLIWGDVPDQWSVLGACVIVAAGIYLAVREAKVKRASVTT